MHRGGDLVLGTRQRCPAAGQHDGDRASGALRERARDVNVQSVAGGHAGSLGIVLSYATPGMLRVDDDSPDLQPRWPAARAERRARTDEIPVTGEDRAVGDGAERAEPGPGGLKRALRVAASVGAVIRPAGFDNAQGIITAQYLKDITDPHWHDAPDYKAWLEWMQKWNSAANTMESANVSGYATAFTMAHVLRQCGDDLTRENIMHQAASMHDLEVPLLLPGIKLNTSPTDFYPIQSVNLARIEGEHWTRFGELLSPDSV